MSVILAGDVQPLLDALQKARALLDDGRLSQPRGVRDSQFDKGCDEALRAIDAAVANFELHLTAALLAARSVDPTDERRSLYRVEKFIEARSGRAGMDPDQITSYNDRELLLSDLRRLILMATPSVRSVP